MYSRRPASLVRAHGPALRRLYYSLPSVSGAGLGFVRKELEDLQSLQPISTTGTEHVRGEAEQEERGGAGERGGHVEISHPWTEWAQLMETIVKNGYLDHSVCGRTSSSSPAYANISKHSNQIRTGCLNFARDRFHLIRYLSRGDIQIMVGSGCPSLDRKVVNSGKRLRAHVGIEEGDVCSSCNLRGGCERAYVKAREDEGGRTVDVMRFLLTYGLDVITGSVENQACLNKAVKESVRKLLNQMVEFSAKELDSTTLKVTSVRPRSTAEKMLTGHQMPRKQIDVPVRQGDWICPKCNFLNFAKNIKCLCCTQVFQERLHKLQEREHLPLKKGDWICEKCNFLNFAKNTRCLQCHEKPLKRQLNPGEWECVSCNYINFRRNMVCLKCDWKRPKALNSEDVAAAPQHDSRGHPCKRSVVAFVRNSSDTNGHHFVQQNFCSEGEDTDFWSSGEGRGSDYDDAWNTSADFDNFPVVGGKSAISQDPLLRERWKGKMSRSRGISGENCKDIDDELCSSSSSEDDIAGWFR